jgi:hypothetical protein
MPVRRRASKRRSTEGLDNWYFVFCSGFDFFDELAAIGVQVDSYGRTSIDDARAAWLRLGEAFLEQPGAGEADPWALAEFGEPWRRRYAR